MSHFNVSQAAYIDQDNRNMAAQGFSMSGTLNDIYDTIAAGSIGITAIAAAVDAVCLANDHFTRDKVTGPGTTLVFAWFTSHFWNGKQRVTVAAGNLTLAASQTNYIEVDANGTVTSNTAAFSTDGSKYPLWIVVTGVGSYTDNNVTNTRCTETFVAKGALTGSLLSTPQKTTPLRMPSGTIATAAGTTKILVPVGSAAGTVSRASFANSSNLAANDTNYVKIGVINLGPSGSGTTAVVDITAANNSTKLTGGSALVAGVDRAFNLSAVGGALAVAANDVLEVSITVVGTLANTLPNSSISIDVAVDG
jgi:hypothetical protein